MWIHCRYRYIDTTLCVCMAGAISEHLRTILYVNKNLSTKIRTKPTQSKSNAMSPNNLCTKPAEAAQAPHRAPHEPHTNTHKHFAHKHTALGNEYVYIKHNRCTNHILFVLSYLFFIAFCKPWIQQRTDQTHNTWIGD